MLLHIETKSLDVCDMALLQRFEGGEGEVDERERESCWKWRKLFMEPLVLVHRKQGVL